MTVDLNIPHDPAERFRQQQIRELAKEIASGGFLVDAIARWTEQVVSVSVAAEREKRRAAEAALEARLAEAVALLIAWDNDYPHDINDALDDCAEKTSAFLDKLGARS